MVAGYNSMRLLLLYITWHVKKVHVLYLAELLLTEEETENVFFWKSPPLTVYHYHQLHPNAMQSFEFQCHPSLQRHTHNVTYLYDFFTSVT